MEPSTKRSMYVLLCIVSCIRTSNAKGDICAPGCKCYSKTKSIECSGKELTGIPQSLPRDTQVLNIQDCAITHLKKIDFEHLLVLVKLKIESCLIRQVDKGAFEGLRSLQELSLYGNKLRYCNNVFVPGMFGGLQNLVFLNIMGNAISNNSNQTYPNDIWMDLPSLMNLQVDAINWHPLPSGLKHLVHLSSLKIGCDNFPLDKLYNTTFDSLSGLFLLDLDISNCHIAHIEPLAFKPLRNISTITINDQYISHVPDILNFFFGLRYSSIATINMNSFYRGVKGLALEQGLFESLQFTKLRKLYLENNRIMWVDVGVLSSLPKSIEFLSLAKNVFYGTRIALYDLIALPNLRTIVVTFKYIVCGTRERDRLPVPLQLQTIIFIDTYLTHCLFQYNNLTSLTLSESTIEEFNGVFSGLNVLKNLSLTYLNCKRITKGVLNHYPALIMLNVSGNYLGDQIAEGEFFAQVLNLTILDISINGIRSLPRSVFSKLRNLTYINIRGNALTEFLVNMGHLKHLRYLDISDNNLSHLDNDVIEELDDIMSNGNLIVNLGNSPLECSCQTRVFLLWLQRRRSNFENFDSYTCFSQNNSKISFNRLDDIVENLGRKCESYDMLITATSVMIAMFCIYLMGMLIYKYRYHLLYVYYSARRSQRADATQRKQKFVFDAFVSFAEEDFRFVIDDVISMCEGKYGLKLCIHSRNFMPGTPIADNITNAIHFSRKTVFILSPDFIKSEWCKFEFSMARMEQLYSGRESLITVLFKPVPNRLLSLDILEAKSRTYLVYPDNEEYRLLFWERLSRALSGEII